MGDEDVPGETDPRDVLCPECRPKFDAAMMKAVEAGRKWANSIPQE